MSGLNYPVYTRSVTIKNAVNANRFVDLAGSRAARDDNQFVGVAQSAGIAGDTIPVVVLGTTTVVAAGAIPIGSPVKVAAAGAVVGAKDSLANIALVVGYALEKASAAGDEIEILLTP